MKNINISMKKLNDMIDGINGAVIGVAKSLEGEYNHDAYMTAMGKLQGRVNALLKECGIVNNHSVKSYIISALEVRTMRFSKQEVKVISGTTFRKWIKTDLFMNRLGIQFTGLKDNPNAKEKKTCSVSKQEYDEFKAWKESHK